MVDISVNCRSTYWTLCRSRVDRVSEKSPSIYWLSGIVLSADVKADTLVDGKVFILFNIISLKSYAK